MCSLLLSLAEDIVERGTPAPVLQRTPPQVKPKPSPEVRRSHGVPPTAGHAGEGYPPSRPTTNGYPQPERSPVPAHQQGMSPAAYNRQSAPPTGGHYPPQHPQYPVGHGGPAQQRMSAPPAPSQYPVPVPRAAQQPPQAKQRKGSSRSSSSSNSNVFGNHSY